MNRRSTPIGLAKVDLSRRLGSIGKDGATSIEALLPLWWDRATQS